ncbi:MAG: hypothetical protein HZA19_06895, partial [Nitrospirae bacterium]|nr:hypothetical protein [Nitrospirota bacterium]
FVYDTVKRTQGKVYFFENEFEFDLEKHWSGTQDEYLRSLKTFYRAVKDANPEAVVIVGGHSGTFKNAMPNQKAFVDRILKEGSSYFDLFDLHLYGNIYDIPDRVAWFRNRMSELGVDKGIVAVEYGGPTPLEFPGEEGREIWAEGKKNLRIFTEGLKGYPVRYRLFAMNIPRELEEKRDRIQAREFTQRTVLGLSSGVRMMLWWNFTAPMGNVKGQRIIHPVFGKLSLVSPDLQPKPNYDAYRIMADQLAGVRQVVRIREGREDIYFYRLERGTGSPKYVLWQRRDIVEGEDLPPFSYEVQTEWEKVRVTDVFGRSREVASKNGKVRLEVTDTPLYLEEAA